MKHLLIPIIFIVSVGMLVFVYAKNTPALTPSTEPVIATFEQCRDAGNPIQESYPEACTTPDGKRFVQDIGNELEHADMIRIRTPRPHTLAQSPLLIEGEARGMWYFEASFPVELLDAHGEIIAWGIAQTRSEWMTESFVPFDVTLTFLSPTTPTGTLILRKDNPSGLPEYDASLRVPVYFKK